MKKYICKICQKECKYRKITCSDNCLSKLRSTNIIGEKNFFYRSYRIGNLNPNYQNGEKIKGQNNVMKEEYYKNKHQCAVSSEEYKIKQRKKSIEMWERLKLDKNKLNNRNQKISKKLKNVQKTEEHRKNLSKSKLGKPSPTKGMKIFKTRGKNHHNWQNGKSFELYGLEFNNELREQIRQRNQYRCQQCFRHQDELYTNKGKKYKLAIHHIDYNKQNNNIKNLISLCRKCHSQTNFNREDWQNYFRNEKMSD